MVEELKVEKLYGAVVQFSDYEGKETPIPTIINMAQNFVGECVCQ